MEDVFSRACLNGDLKTAAELLHVLENMHERRLQLYGRERRISDEVIVRARRELEWRQQSRGDAKPATAA